MREPYLSEFKALLRQGAGTQDIHDAPTPTNYALPIPAYESLIDREIGRVSLYQRSLCPLLEAIVPAGARILDVGCGTGGTSVALALSTSLQPAVVVGLDPNAESLKAAAVRAKGHGLTESQVQFQRIAPGDPLPPASDSFDLTTCISVLEYVHSESDRQKLVNEIKRVTKPGGHIYLATPNPFRLRAYHTGRLFGDFRRRRDHPWASTPSQLRKMLSGCDDVPIHGFRVRRALERLQLPPGLVPRFLERALVALFPWQRLLVRKRAGRNARAEVGQGPG